MATSNSTFPHDKTQQHNGGLILIFCYEAPLDDKLQVVAKYTLHPIPKVGLLSIGDNFGPNVQVYSSFRLM